MRVGIAISDENAKIAFPREVLRQKGSISRIKELVKTENIGLVVIGFPRSMEGRETFQTHEVQGFAEELKKEISIPIEFEDEMLTTRMAEKNSSKEMSDASAAAIILQSYLDKKTLSTRKIKHQITSTKHQTNTNDQISIF